MAIAHSKVTAQGQISVPVDVRRKLGIGPGSVLEWEEDGDKIVVRRAGRFSSEDIHRALFGERKPETRSLDELKEGIRHYARERYARGCHECPGPSDHPGRFPPGRLRGELCREGGLGFGARPGRGGVGTYQCLRVEFEGPVPGDRHVAQPSRLGAPGAGSRGCSTGTVPRKAGARFFGLPDASVSPESRTSPTGHLRQEPRKG